MPQGLQFSDGRTRQQQQLCQLPGQRNFSLARKEHQRGLELIFRFIITAPCHWRWYMISVL